jgi:hypothetical protein
VLLLEPERDSQVLDESEIAVLEAGCPLGEPGDRMDCHVHPERARAVPERCGLRAGLLAEVEEGGFLEYVGDLEGVDCVGIGGLEGIGDLWRSEDEVVDGVA